MFVFPARKLGRCCAGAVLGLDRENPHLSTLSVFQKGKVANPVSFLPGVSKVLVCWSGIPASSRCRSVLLHSVKSHGCLGKWLIPGWNFLSLAQPQRGAGPRGVPGGAVGTGMFSPGVSRVAAWLSAPSPASRPRGLPAFSRLGRRAQADPSGSTVGRAQSTADGFSPSQRIQGYSRGVLTDGRAGDNSLDPGCGRGAFQSLLCPINVDNFSLEEKPYSKVLIPVIS